MLLPQQVYLRAHLLDFKFGFTADIAIIFGLLPVKSIFWFWFILMMGTVHAAQNEDTNEIEQNNG